MSAFPLLYSKRVHCKINMYTVHLSTLPFKTFLLYIPCKSDNVLSSKDRWNIKVYHEKTNSIEGKINDREYIILK